MKVILINTPKGQYHLPLRYVAEHRANYYACEVDGEQAGSDEWQSEVDWVMDDDYEAIDWLINNTDWVDWELRAKKINNRVKVSEDDFWRYSSDFDIVDSE